MKRILALLLTITLFFSMPGCANTASPDGDPAGILSSSSERSDMVVFTDHLGRQVRVPYQPKRVAALIGSFASVWTLAGGELVATANDAWTEFDLGLDESVVNLGKTTQASLEKLLASDPDFIIASSNTQINLDWMDTLETAGIPVAYFDVATFEDYLDMLKICTEITGRPDCYAQNGTQIVEQVEKAKSRSVGNSPRVLYLRATASSVKAKGARRNVLGEMLQDLGCLNIADEDSQLLDSLSLERIIQADPDYIFIVKQGTDTRSIEQNLNELLMNSPAWNGLTAVREGRVYYMDQKLYNLKPNNRWGKLMKDCPISYSEKRKRTALGGAAALCLVAALLSVLLGAARLSLPELWSALVAPQSGTANVRILFYVRLPRTAACLLAGAALAVSGAIIQGVLANPLAAPNIIGVNAGAGLAVTLCCAFIPTAGWGISAAAFTGALCAVSLVVFLAQKTGASRMTVILAGVAVNSVLNSATEAVITLFPDTSIGSADFRIGGFSAVSNNRLWPAAILILLGIILAMTLCNELDLLSMGEETAHGLGLSVKRTRILLLGLAALLAGASVTFAGLLGFVGLIVPHIARRLVGGESAWLLPMCALSGAALVTLCDLAARLLFAPYELPVGILLSFIGGPFFILLLFRQRGGRIHD